MPTREGVTAYEPLTSPGKLKFPELSAVVVAVPAPASVTVAPAPPVITPLIEYVILDPVKFIEETFAPLIVTFWLDGLIAYPTAPGVTV
jgi:hypothetical protein